MQEAQLPKSHPYASIPVPDQKDIMSQCREMKLKGRSMKWSVKPPKIYKDQKPDGRMPINITPDTLNAGPSNAANFS
jgi:hypothetical protein